MGVFRSYNNFNYLIKRVMPYDQIGRVHDEGTARGLDGSIVRLLVSEHLGFLEVPGDEDAPNEIMEDIFGSGFKRKTINPAAIYGNHASTPEHCGCAFETDCPLSGSETATRRSCPYAQSSGGISA